MTDLTQAIAEGRETRMQVRRWFVETGWVDGNGIGLWYGTDESVEVSSRAVAEALRDEWLASGKIERDQWGNLCRTGPYGDFRIRSVWDDVPGELIQLADHKLAVALMVEEAARLIISFPGGTVMHSPPQLLTEAHDAVMGLVSASALADLQALRDDVTGWISNAQVAREKWSEYEARAEAAEADITTYQKIVADMTQEAETDKAELAALRAQVERLTGALGRAQRALKPFADRVFNDNGDCTISDTHTLTPPDYWNAQSAERIALAALTEGAKP